MIFRVGTQILNISLLFALMLLPGTAVSQDNPTAIPDVLISFESEKGRDYAIVVEKESQQLFLYANDGTLREIRRMNCSTGKVRGPKFSAGDLKTPEGIYFFVKEYEDKELAPIYGTGAFPMDYPNLLDQASGRTGTSIWLHGTNKVLKERDSSGCVAIENENIAELAPYITLNRTPIIVTERLSFSDPEQKRQSETAVKALLSGWKKALESGTYHDYLSFYDPEYLPDMSWWPEWNKTRKSFQTEPQSLSQDLKNPLIVKEKDIYAALADQVIALSGNELAVGIKKFFLTDRENQGFRIIAEEYMGLPEHHIKENPFMTAFRNLKKSAEVIARREVPPEPPERLPIRESEPSEQSVPEEISAQDETEIAEMLQAWVKAWSSKDADQYGACYADDFNSQGMSRDAWIAYKKQLNRKYSYIRVSMDNLRITKSGDDRIALFTQNYQSEAFKTLGTKQLILKRENGQWKIFRETYRK